MRTIKYTQIIIALLFCCGSTAQTDISLLAHWDYAPKSGAYEKINKVIATTNGYVVAVGEALSEGNNGLDGLLLMLKAEDGSVHLRKLLGGNKDDSFNSVAQNHDGTLTLVGYTKTEANGGRDGWVMQVDMDGKRVVNLKPASRGSGDDEIKDVVVNSKGIVMAAGWAGSQKESDVWLLRIDGKETTRKTFGYGELGKVEAIAAGINGNFILVGSTTKYNRQHREQAWALKVNEKGEDVWGGPRYFGDNRGLQEGQDVTVALDGGFAIAGVTNTKGEGLADKWLIKIDEQGEIEWDKVYGGANADVATSVIELSIGGYAIFGQNTSYMPRAKNAAMDLIVTDKDGTEITSDFYFGNGDNRGHDLVELYTGDIVIAGASYLEKTDQLSKPYFSAVTYRNMYDKPPIDEQLDGSINSAISLSSALFIDANADEFLEANERGYFVMEVTNKSNITLDNISGAVSSGSEIAGLSFWDKVKLGSIRANQTKQLIIPVRSTESLAQGTYELSIDLEVDGAFAANSTAIVASNRPEPARLAVNDFTFSPGANPEPGQAIQLRLILANAGGTPTLAMDGQFRLPAGVRSSGSERVKIPSIRPQGRHTLNFSFSYDDSYRGKAIEVNFETEGDGALFKTFHINLGKNKAGNAEAVQQDAMLWVSFDPDDNAGSKSFEVTQDVVEVKVKAMSRRALNKRNFALYNNGRRAQGQKFDEVELTKPVKDMGMFRQNYSNKIRLKDGQNKIKIIYAYPDGTGFESQLIVLNYTPKDKPNLYVMSIGVQHDDLKYTTKDAKDFAGIYQQLANEKGRGFKSVSVQMLTKKEETTAYNLKTAFSRLRNQGRRFKDSDLLVVFISSHGKITNYSQQFILKPSDYDPEVEDVSSINFEEDIIKKLRDIHCKKLVFLDACQSGGAFGRKGEFTDLAASKVINDLIQATPGLEIFASCGDREYSYEDEAWENGAFTEAILEAFNDEKVEVDGETIHADIYSEISGQKEHGSDGVITIEELKYFIQKRVPHLVRSTKRNAPTEQNPSNKSTEVLPENMGIYMVNR